MISNSKDLELLSIAEVAVLVHLVVNLLKSFAHRRGPANPHFPEILRPVLKDLLLDESLVPPLCIHTLSAKSNNHLEVRVAVYFVELRKRFTKLETKRVAPRCE